MTFVIPLQRLLDADEVAGHELVQGELLIGNHGGRRKFLSAYEQIHQAVTVPHSEVVAFVRHWNLQGRGAGWIDLHLLASAVAGRFNLWTVEPRLSALAREMGVAYNPSV